MDYIRTPSQRIKLEQNRTLVDLTDLPMHVDIRWRGDVPRCVPPQEVHVTEHLLDYNEHNIRINYKNVYTFICQLNRLIICKLTLLFLRLIVVFIDDSESIDDGKDELE
jgi:hypothetical protein